MKELPQFITEIDGLDIHFIHVRSPHANALPLIMTHGWPGSFLEFVKVIGPLSDPESHGAGAEDAFDLVVPSMPGFGFSARPQASGWNPERIAGAWAELMRRLGYRRYVSQGGDWGAVVTDVLGRQAPDGLVGIHVTTLLGAIERPPTANTQTAIPPEVAKALKNGEPPPAGLSAEETIAYEASKSFAASGSGFRAIQGTRPQTIGYSLADSPVGLAAWFYEKFTEWTDTDGEPERALTKDEMLDDITLYWLDEHRGVLGSHLLGGHRPQSQVRRRVSIPAAVSRFPREIIPHRATGPSAPTRTSSTSTSSTGAVTSPPGNSRNFSRKRFGPRFDHCARWPSSSAVRHCSVPYPCAVEPFKVCLLGRWEFAGTPRQ